jgi:hypothetical protein
MKEVVEEISIHARKSKFVDQDSGVSARLSIANYKQMVASARQRSIRLGESPGGGAHQRPRALPRLERSASSSST